MGNKEYFRLKFPARRSPVATTTYPSLANREQEVTLRMVTGKPLPSTMCTCMQVGTGEGDRETFTIENVYMGAGT